MDDESTNRHRNPSFTAEAIALEDAELGRSSAATSSTDDPGASTFTDADSKRGSIFADRKNRTRNKGKLLVCLSSAALLMATAALVGVVGVARMINKQQPLGLKQAQPPTVEAALQASHTQLQADFEALRTSHTQLRSDFGASQAERVAALELVRTSVTDNTAAIGKNDEQLDAHAVDISGNAERVAGAEATLSTHADDITSTETMLSAHGGRLDEHDGTISAHGGRLDQHDEDISSNVQGVADALSSSGADQVPVVESFSIMSATNVQNRGVYERMHDSVSCNGQPVYATDRSDGGNRYLFQPDGRSHWQVGSRSRAEACEDAGYLRLTCESVDCDDLSVFSALPDVTIYHRVGSAASDRAWAGEE